MERQVLTDAEVAHFIERGHVVLKNCFPREAAEPWVEDAFARIGYDRHDPGTWEQKRWHLPGDNVVDVKEFAPRAYGAICDLCGEDRVAGPLRWSDAMIMNLGIGADEPWQAPDQWKKGWHKDGDFFRHFLDSPEQGLLVIVLWSDVIHRGGGTFIACDSVGPVSRHLARHPEGVLPNGFPTPSLLNECSDFAEMSGQVGDVVLLHPFMLHCASQNVLAVERLITNPPVHLKEPMNLNRENPDDFSPVELSVLRGLGVERLDYQPTGSRERIVPERVRIQEAMRREQAERLAKAA